MIDLLANEFIWMAVEYGVVTAIVGMGVTGVVLFVISRLDTTVRNRAGIAVPIGGTFLIVSLSAFWASYDTTRTVTPETMAQVIKAHSEEHPALSELECIREKKDRAALKKFFSRWMERISGEDLVFLKIAASHIEGPLAKEIAHAVRFGVIPRSEYERYIKWLLSRKSLCDNEALCEALIEEVAS